MKNKYLIVAILLIFVLSNIGCSRSSSDIQQYLTRDSVIDTKAKDIMPNINDLPVHENMQYISTHKSMILFESDSIALIVDYDNEIYEAEKSKLDEKYTFLKEKVKSTYDETKYFIPENEFSINTYNFRVIDSSQSSNIEFPKSFGIIGTSDEKKSIAYLYFYDFDLDYIGEENEEDSMFKFIKRYFNYDF